MHGYLCFISYIRHPLFLLQKTMDHKISKLSNEEDEDHLSLDKSPSFHHFTLQSSPSFHHFTLPSSPLSPQSPESLWSQSPSCTLHSSPFSRSHSRSPLYYSCISSLRHKDQLYSIAVCGDLVLTGSSSRRVHAWQLSSHDFLEKGYIQASSGEVRAMVSLGNNMLFTSHKDHKIRVWEIGNGNNFRPRKVTTLPNIKNFIVFRPIITPQHRLIKSKTTSSQHKDTISCMAYSHVEGLLYTGSYDKTVKTWRLNEKKCIDSFIAHNDYIHDIVINQKNGYIFTCSSDGTVKMWLRVIGEFSHALIKVLTFLKHPIYAMALSISPASQNHNSFLYYGSFDGSINFCELETVSCECNNHERRVIQGHQFSVLCLVALENLVISGSEDSTIRIWRRSSSGERRVVSHECVAILEGHRGPVRCLGARLQERSTTSLLVFSTSLDQTFKVWRVKHNVQEISNYLVDRRSNADDGNIKEGSSSLEFEFVGSPVLSQEWMKKRASI